MSEITGDVTGSVTEKGGVANGTAGVATATGNLDVTDPGSPETFVVQSAIAKTYGSFSIDAAGAWSYTLDDTNADVQALPVGATLHELVTVATDDGTTRQIDITINGANDAATITGTTTYSISEGINQVAIAGLVVQDVDAGQAVFQPISPDDLQGNYGVFSLHPYLGGGWRYDLDRTKANALASGQVVHDTLQLTSADGTASTTIDVTITGTAELGPTLDMRDSGHALDMNGLTFSGFSVVTDPLPTSFSWQNADGFWTITGTGFLYDANGRPAAGTIKSIDVTNGDGQPGLLITTLSLSAAQFAGWVVANTPQNFVNAILAGDEEIWGNALGDNLKGSSGHDTVYGEAGDDVVIGGSGSDHLYGGAGNDTVSYLDDGTDPAGLPTRGVSVSLSQRTATDNWNNTDYLSDFENVIGSNRADTISLSVGGSVWGMLGNDSIFGSQGGGDDTLDGGGGNDTITAQAGDDFLIGGAGSDTLNGSSGIDTAVYSASTANVTANLTTGMVTDGEGGFDTLTSIENVQGGTANDVLIGSSASNKLEGGGGSDRLEGRGGNDQLVGGSGSDTFVVTVGGGNDTVADFQNGSDRFDVTALASSFAQVSRTADGADTILGFGAGGPTVRVLNTATGAIDASDFLFAPQTVTWRDATTALDMTALSFAGFSNVTNNSSTSFRWIGPAGSFWTITGTGFTYGGDNLPTAGTITSIDGTSESGQPNLLVANASISAAQFSAWVTSNNFSAFLSNSLARNDLLTGNAQNDTLTGFADNDTLNGGGGNDALYGGAGSDTLNGGDGKDWLRGESGVDIIDGGDGFDTIDYGVSATDPAGPGTQGVTVDLATGAATDNWGNSETLAWIENVSGSSLGDTITGNTLNNSLSGGGGNDTLNGWIGDDNLYGGAGNDALSGGDGDDLLQGGDGLDTIDGGAGIDTVDFDPATFAFYGAEVDLQAGTALDTGSNSETLLNIENVNGSSASDNISGDDNVNILSGFDGNDGLNGRGGNDFLYGGNGRDTLNGGDGDDWLRGGFDVDAYDGGAGIDTVDYSYVGDGPANYSLSGIRVGVSIGGTDNWGSYEILTGIENINGSQRNDDIQGDNASNSFNGNDGDDTLTGGGGNDSLFGGRGNDTLKGEAGNDLLRGDRDNDTIDGGDGSDTVDYAEDPTDPVGPGYQGVTVNLATNSVSDNWFGNDLLVSIENVNGSSMADTITGDGGSNSLYGADGNDTLIGGAGNDSLLGGKGNDTLDGGAGNDVLRGDGGNDTISGGADNDTVDYTDSALDPYGPSIHGVVVNLSTGTASDNWSGTDTLSGIENVTGSTFADTLVLANVNGVARGRGGNDYIGGGTANDLLFGGSGNDRIDGGAGADTVSYSDDGLDGAGAATHGVTVNLSAGSATDSWNGGDILANIENVTGSSFNDTIIGDGNANSLSGLGGNDSLVGGGGNDNLNGGSGDDVLDGGSGTDAASYIGSTGEVTVNLAAGTATGDGSIGSDTLISIESVQGTAFDDTVTGDGAANNLFGREGDDTLSGGDGGDFFRGSAGNDVIDGGAAYDYARADRVNDFDTADYSVYDTNSGAGQTSSTLATTAGIAVDLAAHTVTGNATVGTDTITNVERVIGTSFADTFKGGGGARFEAFRAAAATTPSPATASTIRAPNTTTPTATSAA